MAGGKEGIARNIIRKEGKNNMEDWLQRTELLLGKETTEKIGALRVIVCGLGGVGAYAAEMLVRSGVGEMLIIDNDEVSATNLNRQLIALQSTIGKKKTDVMAARLLDINPHLKLHVINGYLEEASIPTFFADFKPSVVIDAIDTLSPKIALICYCVSNHYPLVSAMGAGAKTDASAIRIKDISKTYNCPLAYMLRKRLRKLGVTTGFKAVFSEELPKREAIVECNERNKKSLVGTISYLPAVMGCVCAQAALEYFM